MRRLMDVALALETPVAGELLLAGISDTNVDRAELAKYLRHIARNTPAEGLDRLADVVQKRFSDDIDFQAELLLAVNEGILQRGLTAEQGVRRWATWLTRELLESTAAIKLHWRADPAPGAPASEMPWIVESRSVQQKESRWENHPHPDHPTRSPWLAQKRNSSDGRRNENYITSLPPGGESLTGVLRSQPFTAPAELRFFSAATAGFRTPRRTTRISFVSSMPKPAPS